MVGTEAIANPQPITMAMKETVTTTPTITMAMVVHRKKRGPTAQPGLKCAD